MAPLDRFAVKAVRNGQRQILKTSELKTVWFNAAEDGGLVRVLSQAGDILLRRIRRQGADGDPSTSITVLAASERPASNSLTGLTREYELAEYLDGDWALRPLELVQEHGQTTLILEDPEGELLGQLLGAPSCGPHHDTIVLCLGHLAPRSYRRHLPHSCNSPGSRPA